MNTIEEKQPNKTILSSSVLASLSKRQREIIEILEKCDELKSSDILKKLMEPPSERTLRDDLVFLKRLGVITSRGRGLHSVWYRI